MTKSGNNIMIIALLVLGILALSAGMFLALRSWKPIPFTLVVGLIGIVITCFALFGKYVQDKRASDKADKIIKTGDSTLERVDDLKSQNKVLTIKVEEQGKTIDSLREENVHLYAQITGGDSYCVFECSFHARTKDPLFRLKHVGVTPLKNILVTIEDLARRVFLIEKKAKSDYSSPLAAKIIDETNYPFEYPRLNPGQSIFVDIPVEEGQKDIRMKIQISLDNGPLFETLEVLNFREMNRTYTLELKRGEIVLFRKPAPDK